MSGKTVEVRLCVCFSSGVEDRWVVVTELKPLFPAHCSLFHNFKDDNLLIGCGEVELSVFWLLSLVEIDVLFLLSSSREVADPSCFTGSGAWCRALTGTIHGTDMNGAPTGCHCGNPHDTKKGVSKAKASLTRKKIHGQYVFCLFF